MERVGHQTGNLAKLALGALALAGVAVPLAGAFAQGEEAAAEALTAEQVTQGRQLFNDWSCGACHVLSDAGGSGPVGPSLDGNGQIDHEFIVGRVTHGQGAMPGFGGQMSDEEIDLIATYIMQVKK
jgi:mono/diheme cytochrome c family protein